MVILCDNVFYNHSLLEWKDTVGKIIFELKDVHFSYLGKFSALCAVDITIKQGQKIAVIGANGSGKSTLLHLLDGLIFADKGSVKFRGKELKEMTFSDEDFSKDFRRNQIYQEEFCQKYIY